MSSENFPREKFKLEYMSGWRYNKRSLSVLGLALVAMLVFALGCLLSYQKLHDERRDHVRVEAQRMLFAFEAHSTRLFDYADSFLRAARAYYVDYGNGAKWEAFIRDIKAPRAEYFSGIVTVLDREGQVTFQSETPREKLASIGKMADLDHFQYFLKHPGDSLFVGPTRIGRLTGKYQYRLARPLFKNGVFDGMVMLTLRPDHITDFYHNASLGERSSVTMMTAEGKLLARYPGVEAELYDRPVPGLKDYFGIDLTIKDGGSVLDVVSPFDGIRRDIFYKELPDYPVALVVGIARSDIDDSLADARRNLGLLALAFTLAAVLVCALVLRMMEKNRRLISAEAATRMSTLQLHTSEAHLHAIFDASPDAMLICEAEGRITMANQQVEHLLGYRVDELLGQPIELLVPDAVRSQHQTKREEFSAPSSHRMGQELEVKARRKDGVECDVEINLARIQTEQGMFIAASLRDITERRKAESELRVAAAAFSSQEGMVITDANQVILRVNRAFTEITGYQADEVVGQTPRMLKSGRHDAAFYHAMWESIANTGGWQGEVWDRRKNGEEYPKWLTISAVKGKDGEVSHYIGSHFDITERKQAEKKIETLAFFDQLTGLPNRTLLMDRLKQAIAGGSRTGDHGALLFIDLDNFKTLNDTLGHDKGDKLLQQVAKRLSTCLREGDTVARLGGDEFVVVLAGLGELPDGAADSVETVAAKILAVFNQAYLLDELVHHTTASIGATLFHGDQVSIDELMKQADLTMYKAKAAGRNTVRFFDPAMEVAVKERVALEDDLRRALQGNEFLLHYQAQIEGENLLTGAEVLVRWLHPERGLVSPAAFIPLAEETGLIVPLGQWVLEVACAKLAEWADRPDMAHLSLSVNVSAHQINQANFVDQVLMVLNASGANPARLKLELTESMLVDNVEAIIEKMLALKAHGVGFSLDDFGTGFSSLSYLKRLPLNQLKIDQSFVRDVLVDPNDAAIARTIVALAQSLSLGVIAEGVETDAQRAFLANSGCNAYQGYFFSRPLAIEAFERFVLDQEKQG